MENASEIEIEELAKTLELWDKMTSTYEELSIKLLQEGYRKQPPESSGLVPIDYRKLRESVNSIVWLYNQLGAIEKAALSQEIIDVIHKRFETQQSKMVPIIKSKIYDLLDKYKFAQGYVEFVEELCSTVGSPSVPSVEELKLTITTIKLNHWLSATPSLLDLQDYICTDIHRLLTNGKE